MRFTQPELLLLELLLPLLLLALMRAPRRGPASGARGARLLQQLRASGPSGWPRHLPLALLLLALGALLAATARPTMPLWLLTGQRTIVLAIDASGSMSATDVQPDRLSAAKRSAKALVDALPPNVRVGVVAYADDARLVQAPTLQHDEAMWAIDTIRADGGTAIGEGILAALDAALPAPASGQTDTADRQAPAAAPAQPAPTPGSYRSAAIALLTDGRNSSGRDPLQAAQRAAQLGVKVYTVGFGTPDGTLRGGPESLSIPVGLDEPLLQAIARTTAADYFCAATGAELARAFEDLQSRLGLQKVELEVTALFALVAALFGTLGAGLSLAWHGRIL